MPSFKEISAKWLCALIPIAKYRRQLRKKLLHPPVRTIYSKRKPVKKKHWHDALEKEQSFAPLISIIVPNYNHEQYLIDRLESIYKQTYKNYEVILLDDASTDNSCDILEKYYQKYKQKTTLILNEKNSGHVFSQWIKGIKSAKGELIWIAESDDYCDRHFLKKLVPFFSMEAVSIAYSRSDFVNEDKKPIGSIENYLNELDADFWTNSFIETAETIVEKFFSIKNIIPNASSALIRKDKITGHINNPHLDQFRLCGDWFLYLHIIKGGLLAYTPYVSNYYRIHSQGTSINTQKATRYYEEHALLAHEIHKLYPYNKDNYTTFRHILEKKSENDSIQLSDFGKLFPEDLYKKETKAPCLNILMCVYAFTTGGGETFPIYLGNQLKEMGHNVTFINFQGLPEDAGIKTLLREDIPIVALATHEHLEEILPLFSPDVIHTHYLNADGMISKLHFPPSNKPIVKIATMHGMYETAPADYFDNTEFDLDEIYTNIDKFVYIAEKGKKFFADKNYDLSKLTKILNGLPSFDVEPINKQDYGIPDNAFTLCLVSRGIPEKGWLEALEIVQQAQTKTHIPIHLFLVGDGPIVQRIKEQSPLPDNIHLVGFQKNTRAFFAASDLGILPSYFEGESCPLVLIECLMTGKPFCTTEIGETRNLLTGENGKLAGIVIPLKNGRPDVEQFANHIAELANNATQYTQLTANVASAAQRLNIEQVAEQYVTLYRELLTQKKA